LASPPSPSAATSVCWSRKAWCSAATAPPTEHTIRQKDSLNQAQKEQIGLLAARMVQPGDNVIIDSGTTTISLARHLREADDVTVLTNGLNIAWELADAPGVDLILTGGRLRKQSLSLQGAQAEACLSAYNFDKLFLGVDGFDLASPPTMKRKRT
jgi:DeoR family transcriptional regulator of aga operon